MYFDSKFIFGVLCFTFLMGLICGQSNYCPSDTDQSPYCNCSTDTNNKVTLDCSLVKNENQLEEYFIGTFFPTLEVYRLNISNNQDLKYLTRNVFGEVTFQWIYLEKDAIEYINEAVFVNSNSTLVTIDVKQCNLPNVAAFPFSSLYLYTKLDTIRFYYPGTFDVLPKIYSDSLSYLLMSHCSLQYLPIGVFDNLPSLQYLVLYYNNIVSIQPGSFKKNPVLYNVSLNNNTIGRIARGTFQDLEKLKYVFLESNVIELIEPGAFSNLPLLYTLQLHNNQLQYLLIDGFGYLPALQTLQINNNNIKLLEYHLLPVCCPALQTLYADDNELTSISDGMFNGFDSGRILLESNQLKTLDEDWLKAPLRNLTTVNLSGNFLECGCDTAWLYSEPSLMTNLTATCSNGTDIHNLDSSWLSNNC